MAYTGGKSYLSTSLASLPDIAVDYMFAVEFNLDGSKLTFASKFQDLTVKARTCVIPGRSTEVIESWFMGSKQVFPAKTTYTNEVSIKFEEFQDGGTHSLLKKWQDAIYDIKTGTRISNKKKDYSADVIVSMMGTDGILIGEPIVFKTAWIKSVGEPSLSYESGSAISFECTFAYDRWKYASEV